ncbi:MAG: radical SAM protein [Candidatus Saelkia tenebricola]|nr:radical SAM protein [Candidatus Saelkia tenebricola]
MSQVLAAKIIIIVKFMNIAMFNNLIEADSHDTVLVMIPTWYPWIPPMGLAYVESYLNHKGYNSLVYDFNAKLYNSACEEGKKFWDISTISALPLSEVVRNISEKFSEEIDRLAGILTERPESIIGFSVNLLSIHIASSIAQKIKSKNAKKLIVFGGPGCFWSYDRDVVPLGVVDVFVVGEGELPFYEVVDNFYKGLDSSNIKGIVIYKDGKLKDNTPANPVLDLDEIPYPTFEDFDLDDYGQGEQQATLPIGVSRGCISKCTFCVDHVMCNPFRMRSPEHVIKEMEYHISVNGINNFSFNDLLCNGHLGKLEKLCDLIIKRGLKIKWGSYAVARGDMHLRLLNKMKQAGCETICYGIESGSDKILKIMSKIYNSSDAEKVLRLTHKAGIKATFNIIIGYPGESKKEFKETLDFVKRNKKYITSIINVSTLFINPTASLGTNPEKFNIYFPKHPSAFRMVTLKKLFIPRYYKIFGVNKPVLELQGIDFSNFVDSNGNTKPERLKRLIKVLKLIHRLDLVKYDPIINVYPTENKSVKKAIKNLKERCSLTFKEVSLKCDFLGFAAIYHKNRIISSGSGLNVAFRIGEEWYDTSCYSWDIKKIRSNVLKVSIAMDDIGIKQMWTFKFNKLGLFWKINGFFKEKDNSPDEIKLGLHASTLYKYWLSHHYEGEFPELNNEEWRCLQFKHIKEVSVLVDKDEDADVGKIVVNKIKSSEPFSLRLENPLKQYNFRFLAFQNLRSKLYRKNNFNVDLFIKFEKTIGNTKLLKKYFIDNIKSERLYVARKNKEFYIKVQRDDVKLYYKENELTSSYGGNVFFRINGEIFDTTNAKRDVLVKSKFIQYKVEWDNTPLILLWGMCLNENKMFWNFEITSQKKLKLEEIRFGIFLNKDYVNWYAGAFRGILHTMPENEGLLIPLRKFIGNKICIEPVNKHLPSVTYFKPKKVGFFQVGINDLNLGGGKCISTVIENISLDNCKPLKFSSKFEFKR